MLALILILCPALRASSFDVGQFLAEIGAEARAPEFASETCVPWSRSVRDRLFETKPDSYDLADLRSNGTRYAEEIFALRVGIQERLAAQADPTAVQSESSLLPCLTELRRADLVLRYLGDYLVELATGQDTLAMPPVERDRPTFEGDRPELLLSPKVASLKGDVRPGDIFVLRGKAHTSAGIAQLGRQDAQFSHNALVVADPDSGEPYVIESFIEEGVVINPLEVHQLEGYGRGMWLRFRDPVIAARAAAGAWRRVHEKPRIKYDGLFDLNDGGDRLFCSEVPGWAFGPLIRSGLEIPLQLTDYEIAKNPAFFAAMGLKTDVTSAPIDVLFDPRFEILGEWRDAGQLRRLRIRDLIATESFRWMEDLGYRIHVSASDTAITSIAWLLRKVPLLGKKLLGKKMSSYARLPMVRSAYSMIQASDAVEKELVSRMEARESTLGRRLAPQEILEALERLRQDDLTVYERKKRDSLLHRAMRPPRPSEQ